MPRLRPTTGLRLPGFGLTNGRLPLSGLSFSGLGGLVLAALAVAVVCVDPAMGQLPGETPPPEVRLVRSYAVWPGYVVFFLLGAVIVAMSLMSSRRAHTD